MKKDVIQSTLAKLLILLSVVLLCVPAVSHIRNEIRTVKASAEQKISPDAAEDMEYADLIEQARLYNESLEELPLLHVMTDGENERYMSLMNITGTGIMGRISIPKINVSLPIYHGATDDIMQQGAGHMPGSSLPVVSESSHVVIAGHRGLATKAMFVDLPKLEIGDTFEITAMRQTLTYEVDRILTVLPDEVDTIVIEPGKEYCTLVTCTPLGINDHRLLVRGHRIETTKEEAGTARITTADILRNVIKGKVLAVHEVVMLGAAMVLLIVGLIVPCGKAIYDKFRKKKSSKDCA